jgi:hypothetical protein
LFAELEFAGRVEDHALLKAAAFLQDLLRQGTSPRQATPSAFPVAVIAKSTLPIYSRAGEREKAGGRPLRIPGLSPSAERAGGGRWVGPG